MRTVCWKEAQHIEDASRLRVHSCIATLQNVPIMAMSRPNRTVSALS
jgi:hypothetical protein